MQIFLRLVGEIANQTGHEYIYDSHLEGGRTWEKHAQSQDTLDKISSDMWDVVILQVGQMSVIIWS